MDFNQQYLDYGNFLRSLWPSTFNDRKLFSGDFWARGAFSTELLDNVHFGDASNVSRLAALSTTVNDSLYGINAKLGGLSVLLQQIDSFNSVSTFGAAINGFGTLGVGNQIGSFQFAQGVDPYLTVARSLGFPTSQAMAAAYRVTVFDFYSWVDNQLGLNPLQYNPYHQLAVSRGFAGGFGDWARALGVGVYDLEASIEGYSSAAQMFQLLGAQPISAIQPYVAFAQSFVPINFSAFGASAAPQAAQTGPAFQSLEEMGAFYGINPFDMMRLADQLLGLNPYTSNTFEYIAVINGYVTFEQMARGFGLNVYDLMAQVYGYTSYSAFAADLGYQGAYRQANEGGETIGGTNFADGFIGSLSNDVFYGFGATDRLSGKGGNDYIDGGSGDDELWGGPGGDWLLGSAGNDVLDGGTGTDRLEGGTGNDTYVLSDGADFVLESGGTDTIITNVTRSLGTYLDIENMTLVGALNTGAIGNSLANVLTGATSSGANLLAGGFGNDTYVTGAGDRVVENAGQGTDTIASHLVSISLVALPNIENISLTGSANFNAFGNAHGNVITGNTGSNVLYGYQGADVIFGASGNDFIVGGAGIDALSGGAGLDQFLFNTSLSVLDRDTITGFIARDDTIRLENAVYTALGAQTGFLAATAFKSNAGGVATDADDRILYDTATGALFYDMNGSAALGRVQFATLSGSPTLTHLDFLIV